MTDNPDQTPTYQPPGIPYADPKDAKGMIRAINKLLKPRFKMPRGKGIQSNQNVKIGHKKIRYY